MSDPTPIDTLRRWMPVDHLPDCGLGRARHFCDCDQDQRAAALSAVETLVEAARVVNGNGVGEFDTRTTGALFPLRAALLPFVSGAPEEGTA